MTEQKKRPTVHRSITRARILRLAEEDNGAGLCLGCGAEASGCEPDARRYPCESCGAPRVWGAEELLIRLG